MATPRGMRKLETHSSEINRTEFPPIQQIGIKTIRLTDHHARNTILIDTNMKKEDNEQQKEPGKKNMGKQKTNNNMGDSRTRNTEWGNAHMVMQYE